MRPLEIALWASTAALFLWHLSQRGAPGGVRGLPAVTIALLVAHVLSEGPRWHIGPVYVLALYLVTICAWPTGRAPEPDLWIALVGVGFLAAAAGAATLLPVFELPGPTGPHPVGTVTLHLVDPTRPEPRTDRADGRREVLVQIWYPADRQGPGAPYRTPAETTLKTRHLARVRTRATLGVPVATTPTRHPVLLFSPAANGRRNHNTIQAQELASHGFVVVGIDHPYDTDLVVFPDGRTARFAGNPPGDELAATEEALRVRVADARFVLNEVERLDRSDPAGLFTDRLATERVGVFGHSFGGAVAAEMCLTEPRVAAGVNLDGSIYGAAATRGYGKPLLFFCEDVPLPTPEAIAAATDETRHRLLALKGDYDKIRRGSAMQNGQWITIRGALHINYCDSPLYSPVWRFKRGGPIRPERAAEITNAYLLSFFRRHLKGEDDGLLDRPSPPYPEVAIQRPAADER